jgi:hypothetical protein
MLPSRVSGDLLAGTWQLLAGIGAVPKILVWDNEAGIGQHHRLTVPARSFAGTLGTRIYQTAARDPEAKGMVERANQFLQTSFMPGREFTGGADFNTQLAGWLPRANTRLVRSTGARPVDLLDADVAAMGTLPPVVPATALPMRVRLARDYYVRVAGNDYSVDPGVIGRFVDIDAGLGRIRVTCAGVVVADHARCWGVRQVVTDPAHVVTAKQLRTAFTQRSALTRGPARAGSEVGMRVLSDYDALFALTTTGTPSTRPDLKVVR